MPYGIYTDPDVEQIENLFNAVYDLQSETDPETESCRMTLERLMIKKLMDFPKGDGTFKAGRIMLNPDTGSAVKIVSDRNLWNNKTLYLQEPVKSQRTEEPKKETTDRGYAEIAKEIFNKSGWEPYRSPLIMLQMGDKMGRRTLTLQNAIAFGKQLNGVIKAVNFQKAALSDNNRIPEQTRVSIMDTCYDAIKKIDEHCIFGDGGFYGNPSKMFTRKYMMDDSIAGRMTLHYIPEKDMDELVRSLRRCDKDKMDEIYGFAKNNKQKSLSFDMSMPIRREAEYEQMLGDFIERYSTLRAAKSCFISATPPALRAMISEAEELVKDLTKSMDKERKRYASQLNVDWMLTRRVRKAFMTRMLSDMNTGLLSCGEPYLKKLMLKNGMATDTTYDPDTLWHEVLMGIWDIRKTNNQEAVMVDMQVNGAITDVLGKYFIRPGTQRTGSGN